MTTPARSSVVAVLFDVGGVLTAGTALGVRRRVARSLDLEDDRLAEAWSAADRGLATGGQKTEDAARRIASLVGRPMADVLEFWRAAASEEFRPRAELLALARALRSTCRTGILSNTNSLHARVNRGAGLYDGFDPVLLSCELGLAKPDPRIFRRALDLLGTRPERCVLVDDRSTNARAACAEGMRGIRFTTTKALADQLRGLGLTVP